MIWRRTSSKSETGGTPNGISWRRPPPRYACLQLRHNEYDTFSTKTWFTNTYLHDTFRIHHFNIIMKFGFWYTTTWIERYSIIPSINRRSSFRSCIHPLQLLATGCLTISLPTSVLPSSQNIPISKIISWHYNMIVLFFFCHALSVNL